MARPDMSLVTPSGTPSSLRELKAAGQAGAPSVEAYRTSQQPAAAPAATPPSTAAAPSQDQARASEAATDFVRRRKLATTLLTSALGTDHDQLFGS